MASPLAAFMDSEKIDSIRSLADRLKLERSFVSRLLSGERKPGLETALHIEGVTGGKVKASSWAERRRERRARRQP